ncbi:MAG: hypothetical protein HYR62_09505 [Actinobacteria bacterium]|nr:hypothetical protein [Actinomycetota bacterium]MBI3688010.1 hypothetical protein [Actinomycetota bacterium]
MRDVALGAAPVSTPQQSTTVTTSLANGWHRPRIGIYDRWAATAGCGERYMAAMARILAETSEVELIGHEAFDAARLRDALGVDLSGIGQRVVPLDSDYRSVQAVSAGYDVFINISAGDVFPALAPVNMMVVLTPGAPPMPVPGDAEPDPVGARAIPLSGLYPPDAGLDRFVRWSGPELRILLEELPATGPAAIRLVAGGMRTRGASSAEIALFDERGPLERWRLPNRRFFGITVPLPEPRPSRMMLRLETTTFRPSEHGGDDERELGLALADLSVVTTDSRKSVDYFPRPGGALARWTPRRRALWEVSTYDLLVPVSRFVDGWAKARWGRGGDPVYPPVAVERAVPVDKEDVIVGLGAFSAVGPDPAHLAMVQMFRRLCDEGLTGWRLRLAGPTDPSSRDYLREVYRAVEGYPITIHADPELASVNRWLSEARIYWDATGLGADDRVSPHPFEPFACGTVQAMAAGCVPVVYRRGSMPEIVHEGVSGLLWDTPAQCIELTRSLTADRSRRDRLAGAAAAGSVRFGEATFRARLAGITEHLAGLLAVARR